MTDLSEAKPSLLFIYKDAQNKISQLRVTRLDKAENPLNEKCPIKIVLFNDKYKLGCQEVSGGYMDFIRYLTLTYVPQNIIMSYCILGKGDVKIISAAGSVVIYKRENGKLLEIKELSKGESSLKTVFEIILQNLSEADSVQLLSESSRLFLKPIYVIENKIPALTLLKVNKTIPTTFIGWACAAVIDIAVQENMLLGWKTYALKLLEDKIRKTNAYLSGDVFGYTIECENNITQSNMQFYGSTLEETGILKNVFGNNRVTLISGTQTVRS